MVDTYSSGLPGSASDMRSPLLRDAPDVHPLGVNNTTSAPSDLMQRVVQGAHHTIDQLADTAAPHVQRLQEGVSAAGDALSQRGGDLREIGDEWTESLRTTVRDHPIGALVTAVAVGMLLSRFSSR